MQLTPYHAKYYAYELTKQSASDSIQKLARTLVDAQVDLNPHQVEAALFAFRSPLSMGAILADEVGLGKTIEAGLVISQKWAERKRKILIISPSSLRKQWNQELSDKFFIPSIVLEAKAFKANIKSGNLNPFDQKDNIVICSFHFARNKDSYIRATKWDLVIIDEAHKLRNVYKPSNKIGKAIKKALKDTPKILLTATPLQNSLLELYGLVSIIDDYAFGDLKSFKQQYSRLDEDAFLHLKERLKPLCKRTLRRDVLEYIKYTNRIAILKDYYSTNEEQRLYDLVSNYLQKPVLYALPASQRMLMTLILRKLLASSTYAISGTLQRLVYKLEAILAENTITVESIEDLQEDYEAYDETEDEWFEDEDEDEEEFNQKKIFTQDDLEAIKEEIEELRTMSDLAHSIKENSKGDALLSGLKVGFEKLEEQPGANRKAIIFTESRRTQEYLKELLERSGYAGELVLFNGTNNGDLAKSIYEEWLKKHAGTDRISGAKSADKRAALVDYFRNKATIMIATEAAAEGINLQFCSLLVNYDLPWNPQRIEQRIGRCHRYGQRFDVVVINFLNERNAAEKRIYQLLNEKFHLFDGVFGASDEILGSLESGVDFEKRIAEIYQNCRSEEEIQASFDALQAEMDQQIQEEMGNTKQKLLDHFDEEVHEKLRISLEKSKDYLNKYEAWLWQITKQYLQGHATFSENGKYAFNLHESPSPEVETGRYRIGKNIDDAHTYRIGHPLAQHIIQKCKSNTLNSAHLTFDYSGTRKIISILESYVGQSGWLTISNVSIRSLEEEDHVLFAAITDEGEELGNEECHRLFSLNAIEQGLNGRVAPKEKLDKTIQQKQDAIIQSNMERNADFFDDEMDKLDNWADDKRKSLRQALKDLDDQIKVLKRQARTARSLPEKLSLQKKVRAKEQKRDQAWKDYDVEGRKIEAQKDELIQKIELQLDHRINIENLFTIRWTLQ